MVRNQVVNKVANEGFKQGGKKVGMDCCTCWNNGRKGTARVATKSLLFVMTEPREHALEQSESAVGVVRSRVSQK